MKKIFMKGVFGYIAAWFITIAFSWLVTCGIVKLITLCFGIAFSWPIATGIWLCLWLLSTIFGGGKK